MLLGVGLVGLAAGSQAPEFSQQYRQRLGGAIDELAQVLVDFDADALNSGLKRDDALKQMADDATPFVRDRAQSMNRVIVRHERLTWQSERMEEAPGVMRPLILARYPDTWIVTQTWQDFEPAVPLTMPGLVWGGTGLVAFLLAGWATLAGASRLGGSGRKALNPVEAALKADHDLGMAIDEDPAMGEGLPVNGEKPQPYLEPQAERTDIDKLRALAVRPAPREVD